MIKRISAFAIALLLLASVSLSVLAAGVVDLERDVRLTVTHTYEDIKLADVSFELYLIATMDISGELTPAQEFLEYEDMLDIRGENDDAWYTMALVLEELIAASDTIAPTDAAVTDQEGVAAFPTSGKTLTKGLYLVMGTETVLDGYLYSTLPFLVLLPGRDSVTDEWVYDVQSDSKPGRQPVLADISVVKVWRDFGHTEERPQTITIRLLRDGEPYGDPVTLPHNGEWSYTWERLESAFDWYVEELYIENYTAEVTREGNTFVVTNTLDKPKLPQTGQMNWPIPVMTVSGLALFLLGWFLCFGRKRDSYEK